MITKRLILIAALACVIGAAPLAQTADPLVGTWKLNAAKSKGVKSGTSRIEAAGKGFKFSVESVAADGTARQWSFVANLDGKDVPITGNNQSGNMANLTRVDANTIRITTKQDGKVMTTSTIVLAADGKTRTTTTKGTGLKGEPIDSVAVYEKQ